MFLPKAAAPDGQRAFEVALVRDHAPLPWDGVFDDDKVAIIDSNGNDVGFILVGVDRERALRLARLVIAAANLAGGYVPTEPLPL